MRRFLAVVLSLALMTGSAFASGQEELEVSPAVADQAREIVAGLPEFQALDGVDLGQVAITGSREAPHLLAVGVPVAVSETWVETAMFAVDLNLGFGWYLFTAEVNQRSGGDVAVELRRGEQVVTQVDLTAGGNVRTPEGEVALADYLTQLAADDVSLQWSQAQCGVLVGAAMLLIGWGACYAVDVALIAAGGGFGVPLMMKVCEVIMFTGGVIAEEVLCDLIP